MDKNSKLLPLLAVFAMNALACDSGDACEQPTVLDRALVTPSPEQFQDLSTCTPRKFDLANAVKTDGSLTLAWLVAHEKGSGSPPDAINALSLTLDPCTSTKAQPGEVITIEVLVLSGTVPLSVQADADQLKAFAANNADSVSVIWFAGWDSMSCCGF
jgi:hypothetical protein